MRAAVAAETPIGVKAKAVTARSDLVATAIMAAAKKNKCDLIVMASHGRKGISRILLGGTSLLIVVTTTMDTVAQVHGHLLAHQYEGLVKKAKLRGAKR